MKGREARHAAVHGVTKNWAWLSDWATTKLTYNVSSLATDKTFIAFVVITVRWVCLEFQIQDELITWEAKKKKKSIKNDSGFAEEKIDPQANTQMIYVFI